MIRALRRRADARVAALRTNRDLGAADPAIVMITIVVLVVLALGGMYAGRGFVEQARNTNAQSDLDRIASSEEFYAARASNYTDDVCDLIAGDVSFRLSQDVEIRIDAVAPNDPALEPAWVASARHTESGKVFFKSSLSSSSYQVLATGASEVPKDKANTNVAPPAGLSWSSVTTNTTPVDITACP